MKAGESADEKRGLVASHSFEEAIKHERPFACLDLAVDEVEL